MTKGFANDHNLFYLASQLFWNCRWLEWDLKWVQSFGGQHHHSSLHFKQCHYSVKATRSECFRFPGKLEATCVLSWTLQRSKSRSNTSLVLSVSYHGLSSAGLSVSSITASISSSALKCLATWLCSPILKRRPEEGDRHRYSYTEINLAEAHRNLQILLVNYCISSFLIFQNPIVLKQLQKIIVKAQSDD